MTARTSPAEVRGMFSRLVRAAGEAGIDASGWVLEEGSVTYGRAWRVYEKREGSSGLYEPKMGSYLGRTAREASLSLHAMARVLELVPAREGATR